MAGNMSLIRVVAGKTDAGAAADITTHLLSEAIDGADRALVTQTAIHGKTTAGGGAFVDVKVSPAGAIQVGGTLDGITALPLPSGASTSANQTTGNASLSSIDGKTPALVSGRQPVDGSGVTQPISAAALPLPAGAATETTLSLISSRFADFHFDAGARQRVSQLTTLADLKILNADDGLFFENVGTGTGAYSNNKYNMTVTSGQYFIKRSLRYYPYFSGKSQLIECTFDGFQPETNVTKRVGYFSSDAVAPYDSTKDGFWLESAGGTVTLKCARAGTETLSVAQSAFNGNTLSGHDWSGFNVTAFDYLWLGGFQLRLFVKTSAGFVLAHTFAYAGTGQADTFTLSPNQCVRYEIRSTTGSGSFRYICAQVSTEGSTDEAGKQFSVNTGSTAITLATIGKTYPVLGIRKRTGYRDNVVKITDIAGFVSTNTDALLITLQLNPTLSAALTYAAVGVTAFESANGNGTITVTTPGALISSAYLSQNTLLPTGILDDDYLTTLGITISGVSDQIIVCATPITATVGTFMSIDLKQY